MSDLIESSFSKDIIFDIKKPMKRALLLDNYDSFTHNLEHLIKRVYRNPIDVIRNDREIPFNPTEYEVIIISPGPGRPATTPKAMELIKECSAKVPLLGICLGMQCINEYLGGSTIKAPGPVHGKTSLITHREKGLFTGLTSPLQVARYHSLQIMPSDPTLITAETEEGIAMALEFPEKKLYGLQFHPESFLTPHGEEMIRNFFNITGIKID